MLLSGFNLLWALMAFGWLGIICVTWVICDHRLCTLQEILSVTTMLEPLFVIVILNKKYACWGHWWSNLNLVRVWGEEGLNDLISIMHCFMKLIYRGWRILWVTLTPVRLSTSSTADNFCFVCFSFLCLFWVSKLSQCYCRGGIFLNASPLVFVEAYYFFIFSILSNFHLVWGVRFILCSPI